MRQGLRLAGYVIAAAAFAVVASTQASAAVACQPNNLVPIDPPPPRSLSEDAQVAEVRFEKVHWDDQVCIEGGCPVVIEAEIVASERETTAKSGEHVLIVFRTCGEDELGRLLGISPRRLVLRLVSMTWPSAPMGEIAFAELRQEPYRSMKVFGIEMRRQLPEQESKEVP